METPQPPQPPQLPDLPPLITLPLPTKQCIQPNPGEIITSLRTNNTYTIGQIIGEGAFSIVYSCIDVWGNELAAKVLKPHATYEKVRASAEAEFLKLLALRHPNITYIYDAFEFRDTFYIITERCFCPVSNLFTLDKFNGLECLMPIARCLLQAVHYIHINGVVHQDIHAKNVFTAFVRDEMPSDTKAIQFKLADLGVAKLLAEVNAQNTRAQWMLPPEAMKPEDFGPLDFRLDIYHVGLLLLQLAMSREMTFTIEEVLDGKPRTLAETLPSPLNFALGKALRRHVQIYRTSSAMELWRDLNVTTQTEPPLLPAPTNVEKPSASH